MPLFGNNSRKSRTPQQARRLLDVRLICCIFLVYMAFRLFFNTPEDADVQTAVRYGVPAGVLLFSVGMGVFTVWQRIKLSQAIKNQADKDAAENYYK